MLKTLEESNEKTLYILLADSEKKLLKTILSRCQKHHPREKSEKEVAKTPEILDMDLAEKFKLVEKICEKAKREPAAIEKFLQNLENYYRTKLPNGKKQNVEALQAIDEARKRINANANKQFSLENLLLKIDQEL
jgi:DNA polymerase III gamma/tau subunit